MYSFIIIFFKVFEKNALHFKYQNKCLRFIRSTSFTAIMFQHLFPELPLFLIFPKDMIVFFRNHARSCQQHSQMSLSFTNPLIQVYIKTQGRRGFISGSVESNHVAKPGTLYEFPSYLLTPAVFH